MGRQGANWRNALAGLRTAPKRSDRNAHAEWWGAERLALVLGVGGKDGFNRMALGRTPIAAETAVSCMRELINGGLLHPREVRALPSSIGHARALLPFGPVLPELRKAKCCQIPSDRIAAHVEQLAESYRAALVAKRGDEVVERKVLREARADAVCALLDLQTVVDREPHCADYEILKGAAAAIARLDEAMNAELLSSCEVALSPREAIAGFARQFAPPAGPDGQPDFAGLFKAASMGAPAVAVARTRVIEQFLARVADRWGVDPRTANWQEAEVDASSAWKVLDLAAPSPRKQRPRRRVRVTRRPLTLRSGGAGSSIKVPFQYARNAGAPPREVRSRYCGLAASDLKFMRRVTRPGGLYDPRFLLTMAMAEEWYFDEDRPDCRQTDFENRLAEIDHWARTALERLDGMVLTGREHDSREHCEPVRPTRSGVKRLIRELMRLDVRPRVELNLDMPEPASLPAAKN